MISNQFFRSKRVFFDRIFERSFWTWRKHPAIMVPTMLGTALQVMEQSVVTLALMLLLTGWAFSGALPSFLTKYETSGPIGAFQDPSFGLTLILVIAATAAAVLAVAVIGGGYVYSSEYGLYVEAWSQESVPVKSVLTNGSHRWKAMAWTLIVSNLITWGPAVVGYGLVLGSASSQNLLSLVASSYILLPLILASLVLSLFTIYSYPAVVIDKVSGFSAVRHSFRIASHNLGLTLTYSIVRLIFRELLFLVAAFASVPGIGLPLTSLITIVLSLLLTPILHLTKTMIYYHARPVIPEMPFQLSPPVWHDVFRNLPKAGWLKVRAGLSDGLRYVIAPRNYPYHLGSALALFLGIYLGYYVSVNGVAGFFLSMGYQPGHGNSLLSQIPPLALPALGIDIFLNNWLVSIATALSGLGFGAPSFITILFNGFILGILVAPQLSPNFTMFLAAILPHGIIEIPSFVLAGSVGLNLGYAAFKAKLRPGSENDEYLSNTLRKAVYIVVGLAPLFLIAGLIEADITPWIMRMFGWTI